MGKLTDTFLKRSKLKNGVYGDGDRLYLRVQGPARSWLFIYTDAARKRRELGLGGYPAVSLGSARKTAQTARDLLATGGDPIEAKEQTRKAVVLEAAVREEARTLAGVCEEWIRAKESQWSAIQVADRYRGYVVNYLGGAKSVKRSKNRSASNLRATRRPAGGNVKPLFSVKRIDSVTVADIEQLLKPVWHTPTGPYLRSFLERVFDFAMVKGYVPQGLNVARYRGHLEHVLANVKRVTVHHTAMPWAEVPACMERLRERNEPAAAALRFTILTASRQLEVREMRWCEVHEDRWVIPAERYKTRKEHIVPLPPEALNILDAMRPLVCDFDAFVFSGFKARRPISQHIFKSLLGGACDPHGFRTSFVVWCVEAGGFTDELAQRCLGHVIGTETTRAYQRSDFIAQRKAALEAWGRFLVPPRVSEENWMPC